MAGHYEASMDTSGTDKNGSSPRNDDMQNDIQFFRDRGSRLSDITLKLVCMGVRCCGSHLVHLTEEIKSIIALDESRRLGAIIERFMSKIQQDVQCSKTVIGGLTDSVYSEEEKEWINLYARNLIDRIKTTDELIAMLTEHINYLTETLEICQEYRNDLFSFYNNKSLEQRVIFGKLGYYEKMLQQRIIDIEIEINSLREISEVFRKSYENKLIERDGQLDNVVAQCQFAQKQLDEFGKETMEISHAAPFNEINSHDS